MEEDSHRNARAVRRQALPKEDLVVLLVTLGETVRGRENVLEEEQHERWLVQDRTVS